MIDCSAVALFEYTAIRHFRDFDDKLQDTGVELWIADLNPEAFKVVGPSNFGQALGHERMFFNLEQAVEAYISTRQNKN